MSNPYVGEIRMFAGNFAPVGWAFCNGQLLAISEYDALFNLLGTTYGGDGVTKFALPNLQGRLPIHMESGHVLGSSGGAETVTLAAVNVPDHTHAVNVVSGTAHTKTPAANLPANAEGGQAYSSAAPDVSLGAGSVGAAGVSAPQPHGNLQPFLCVNFIISLFGVYPSQG